MTTNTSTEATSSTTARTALRENFTR
jgi:hypothetical protein